MKQAGANRPSAVAASPTLVVWPAWQRGLHWALAAAIIVALLTWNGGRVHEIAGYAALGAAAARIALGFAGPGAARFGAFVRGFGATLVHARKLFAGTSPRYVNHTPLGAWMIVVLLALSVLGAGAGALYVTDRFWGEAWVVRLHALLCWPLLALVPLHVAGVVHASIVHRENLVRTMLDGRKRVD